MIVVVDRVLCIGAAPCVAVAGNVFQLDEEGKAIVIGPSTDDNNTHLAAEACPTRAIFLYSDDKKQLFPLEKDSPRPFQESDLTNNPSAPASTPAPAGDSRRADDIAASAGSSSATPTGDKNPV